MQIPKIPNANGKANETQNFFVLVVVFYFF